MLARCALVAVRAGVPPVLPVDGDALHRSGPVGLAACGSVTRREAGAADAVVEARGFARVLAEVGGPAATRRAQLLVEAGVAAEGGQGSPVDSRAQRER